MSPGFRQPPRGRKSRIDATELVLYAIMIGCMLAATTWPPLWYRGPETHPKITLRAEASR